MAHQNMQEQLLNASADVTLTGKTMLAIVLSPSCATLLKLVSVCGQKCNNSIVIVGRRVQAPIITKCSLSMAIPRYIITSQGQA